MSKSLFQKRNKASSDPCDEGLDCAEESCEHEERLDCDGLNFADDPDNSWNEGLECADGSCNGGIDCADDPCELDDGLKKL